MSTKKIKWRLSALPTPTEVAELVKDGILTKDEAREILFSLETDSDRDTKGLQDEIKFLRELVQRLSHNSRTEIVKTIEFINNPYHKHGWFKPYEVYCGVSTSALAQAQLGTVTTTSNSLGAQTALYTANSGGTTYYSVDGGDFTKIKTF